MKRFFNDDPEDNFYQKEDIDDDDDDGDDDDMDEFVSRDELLDMMGIDIIEAKMSVKLLTYSAQLAKKGTLFWKWRSLTYQMTRIHTIYLTLVAILNPPTTDTPEGVDDAEL